MEDLCLNFASLLYGGGDLCLQHVVRDIEHLLLITGLRRGLPQLYGI